MVLTLGVKSMKIVEKIYIRKSGGSPKPFIIKISNRTRTLPNARLNHQTEYKSFKIVKVGKWEVSALFVAAVART